MKIHYESIDFFYIQNVPFVETFFKLFVSFIHPVVIVSLDMKFMAYNWFRMFILELCENLHIEQLNRNSLDNYKCHRLLQKRLSSIFNTLILTELKQLRISRQTSIPSEECLNSSLQNAALGWFLATGKKSSSTTTDHLSSTAAIDLCITQLLMLLLRCIHFYDHIRSICATTDYIQELLNIFHNNQQ
ncbi:unnamed protein product, partial [Rotaria sp. Silwood2]